MTVDNGNAVVRIQRVVAVFIEPRADEPVAVLRSGDVVAVFRIFARDAVVILHRELWHTFLELCELPQERLFSIEGQAIVERIPVITPPARDTVHRIRCIRTMRRDDMFPTEIAVPRVDMMFIAPCETSLLSAGWAECRRGDQALLSVEDR